MLVHGQISPESHTSDRRMRWSFPVGLIGFLLLESEGPSGGVSFRTILTEGDDDTNQP